MAYIKIGYIARYDLELNPHLTEKFKFKEATFTRRISSRGDRVYSKMLACPVLLDDELREKCIRWVEWANKVDEKEYSFLA